MQRRLDSLDGLRGLAALVVVFCHLLLLQPRLAAASFGRTPPLSPLETALISTPLRLLWGGNEAVWIFFVLSGYVLTRRQLNGEPTLTANYFWRRACRLYIPMAGSLLLASLLRAIPHRAVSGGSFWLNAHAASSNPGDVVRALLLFGGNDTALNSVWWSLQWEAWFSLAVPALLLLCRPVRRHLWIFGVACVIASAWGSTAPELAAAPGWNHAVLYLPMFGVGIAIAAYEPRLLAARWMTKPQIGWPLVVGSVTLYWAHFRINAMSGPAGMGFRETIALSRAMTLMGAAGFVLLSVAFGQLRAILSARPLKWIGVRSYSLYLVHEPVLVSLGFALHVTDLTPLFVLTGLGASFLVTEVFHRAVEMPSIALGHWRRIRVGQPQRQTLRLG